MVPKKTKHLPFTFVFVVYVLQDIPLFLGKKKKVCGEEFFAYRQENYG